jgi:hypothetical protein
MKTVFDEQTRQELLMRISGLKAGSQPLWGTLNVYQMVQHCIRADDMLTGTLPCKRIFLGRIIGRLALRKVMADDQPFMKNAVTSGELKVAEVQGDLREAITKWTSQIKEFANYNRPSLFHPFFGQMTREQVGYLAYKHIDHHLRQFNC